MNIKQFKEKKWTFFSETKVI